MAMFANDVVYACELQSSIPPSIMNALEKITSTSIHDIDKQVGLYIPNEVCKFGNSDGEIA